MRAGLFAMPVNSLKIDKLFVDGVPTAERQTALVEGIIGIAKSLHLQVIAEGIETGEQCEALTLMGATILEGVSLRYLFAGPRISDPELYRTWPDPTRNFFPLSAIIPSAA